ncbi:hypothetical protein LPB86_06745 [Pedobacter sp. MC2016-14]|uniref:hypothetical protein n=1 Tax=Pedobacter sp. MC2016-14 TaxID=2897327 RepID=UPI001E5BB5AC|nr:hypothetical protein [Pedobacter sp. MC2016-14]MCD0487919.1 hypothetical protein [Pedobacter sp. MC2016-14]
MSTITSKIATIDEKDVIILLEDVEAVIKAFEEWIEDANFNIELVVCRNYEQYDEVMARIEIRNRIRCMVMDLSNNKEEETAGSYQSVGYINEQYSKNRVPIFIHSGFLESFTDLADKGTVFRVPKKTTSVDTICSSIKSMHDSGFLDIFSIGGSLEKKIMSELHDAFVDQFKANEIEGIISSIKSASSENVELRTKEVFERLALRAVYQNAISNKPNQEGIKVNSIEHYYRRNTKKYAFWTGDIFKVIAEGAEELLFLATPRCNISNGNYEKLLFFKVNPLREDQKASFSNTKIDNKDTGETKGQKQIRTSITDDVTNSFVGERFRFLPKTPQFEGGFVDCMKCITVSKEDVDPSKYNYVISLVDDLTNDVVRKAAAYLLRGGISDTAYEEAIYYFTEELL